MGSLTQDDRIRKRKKKEEEQQPKPINVGAPSGRGSSGKHIISNSSRKAILDRAVYRDNTNRNSEREDTLRKSPGTRTAADLSWRRPEPSGRGGHLETAEQQNMRNRLDRLENAYAHNASNVDDYALDSGRQKSADEMTHLMAQDKAGQFMLGAGEGLMSGLSLGLTDRGLAANNANYAGLSDAEMQRMRTSDKTITLPEFLPKIGGAEINAPTAYGTGRFAGQLAGYMIPSNAAAGAIQNTALGAKALETVTNSSVGKWLVNQPWLKNAIARSFAKQGIQATEDMILGKAGEFATRLGIDLMTDVPLGVMQSHNQTIGDGVEFASKDYWKQMALNTGIDIAAGGAMNAAPIAWNAAGNVLRPNAYRQAVRDAGGEALETAAEQAARTATRGPRAQNGTTFRRPETMPRLDTAAERTARAASDIDAVFRTLSNKQAAKLNDDILSARVSMAGGSEATRANGAAMWRRTEKRIRKLLERNNITNGLSSGEIDGLTQRAMARAYENIHTGGDLRGQAFSYEGIRQNLRSVEDSGVGDFIRGLDNDTITRANNASPREAYAILENEARKIPRSKGMTDEAYEAMIRDRTQQGYNVLKEEASRPARQLPTRKELENAPDMSYNKSAGGLKNGPEQDIANTAGTGDNLGDVAGEIQGMAPRSGGSEVVPGRGVQPASGGGYDANDVLTPQHREVANRYNVTNTMKDSSNDYPSFIDYIDANKATQKYGIAVDTPSVEKLSQRGAKAYLVNNGNACIAVASDGDVIALVKKSGAPHTDFDEAMITAIANGGTKCDAYGIKLANGYAEYGFEPVARIPYDPNVIREIYGENAEAALSTFKQIAPPGREGPDVYVFMHNGDDLESVLRKNRAGDYKVWTQAELDDLPTFTGSPDSYDEALAYRDNLLSERLNKNNNGAGSGSGNYPNGTTGGYTNDVVDISGTRESGYSSTVGYHPNKADQNIMNNGAIPEETRQLYELFQTETEHRSVKQAIENGHARIAEFGGADRAYAEWNRMAGSNTRLQSDDYIFGVTLARELDSSGKHFEAANVYGDLAVMSSDAGRMLQAANLLRAVTPEGRRAALEKMVRKMSAANKNIDLRISDDLLQMLDNATNQKELEAILETIKIDLWNQVPLSVADKLRSFRYLAMLGNPKTHIRNIVGNVIFTPARRTSDFIATLMERALPQAQRSRTLTHNKELMDLAQVYLDASRGDLASMTRWNASIRDNGARSFNSRVLQTISDASNWSLEHGDTFFSDPEFRRQFAGYIQAKGYNINTVTRELADEAAEVASRRSLEATFRNANRIADAINSLKQSSRTANFVTEAVIPFVKTPTNVLIKATRYTPEGLIEGVGRLIRARDGKAVTDAISILAEGMTGTGIGILGWWLAKEGVIQPSLDTSTAEGKFRSEVGEQAYSVRIGNTSYTLDWAAPACIPMFIGAEIAQISDFDDVPTAASVVEGFANMLNPAFEMSMLSGLENALDIGSQNDVSPVISLVGNIAKNYGSSFVPSVVRQIARTTTPYKRTSTSTAESPTIRDAERYVRNLMSGIPGANNLLEPYVNNLGERDSKENAGDYLKAAVQNFLSPGTLATRRDEPVTSELQSLIGRVSDEEGKSVIPPNVSGYTVSLGGQEYRMTESELTKFKETRGQYSREHLNELFNSAAYRQMNDQDKVEAVKDIYADALHYAQDEFMMDHGMTRTDVAFYRLSGQTQAKYDESYMDKKLFVDTYNATRSYSTNNGKAMAAAEAGLSLEGLNYFNDIKDEQWRMAQYAVRQGLTASQVEEIGRACDLDGNGSRKRDEIIVYLDHQNLTREQKMVLFDMLSTSKNNPYR